MYAERVESLWRSGDRPAAMALARAVAERDEPLPLAEALLRCARDANTPEWEEAARLAVGLREKAWPPGHTRAGYAARARSPQARAPTAEPGTPKACETAADAVESRAARRASSRLRKRCSGTVTLMPLGR